MLTVLLFIFGACVGSFLNVVILRLPEEQSLTGRSHCPNCGNQLAAFDIIPLLSYLFLRGRCRNCKIKISPRYFIIELTAGVLSAASLYFFPVADALSLLLLIRTLFIIYVLIVVFTIDYEHFLILDKIIFSTGGVFLVFNIVLDFFTHQKVASSLTLAGLGSALGLGAFFGLIYFLSKGAWIGLGDVKFALLLGLATPYPLIVVNLLLAFLIGAVVGIFLLIFKGKGLKSEIPFGTFLSISTLIVLYQGPTLVHWYFGLLGLN